MQCKNSFSNLMIYVEPRLKKSGPYLSHDKMFEWDFTQGEILFEFKQHFSLYFSQFTIEICFTQKYV